MSKQQDQPFIACWLISEEVLNWLLRAGSRYTTIHLILKKIFIYRWHVRGTCYNRKPKKYISDYVDI